MQKLHELGWDLSIQTAHLEQIARIITVQKNKYRIFDGQQEYLAHLSGTFLNEVKSTIDFPTVGDWVQVKKLPQEQKAVIERLLPRKSQFIRQAAGSKMEAQVVAANIDLVLIVTSLNHDFNVRRIERYMLAAYESGASPVIVLTKRDMCSEDEVVNKISQVMDVAIGVPVVSISSITGAGIEDLVTYLSPGKTAVLLGSSGVGKSTLLNVLLNKEVQQTEAVRDSDSKGRHTTTHREMFLLANGAILIDKPGMRELQLWDGEDSVESTFGDIEDFAAACRFQDCQHDTEPGCRVKAAVNSGELSEERFHSYKKLQREVAYEKRRRDQRAKLEEKKKWQQLTKKMRKNRPKK